MATLVLSAVGGIVAGPLGAAVGLLAGGVIDQKLLFPAKPRQGPRLDELPVQLSRYGSDIPRVYGTMRVAGTVIWALPIREQRTRQSGGKGRPDGVGYAYSASFAVALSSRKAIGIGRIWADGRPIRDADGATAMDMRLRFHNGDDDQPADPLIASAEGIDTAPAYRGIAYVVFEDLPLAGFGNRIPQLSFEIIADGDAPAIGTIIADATGGAVASGETATIGGYALAGTSARDGIRPLVDLVQTPLWRDAAGWRIDSAPPVRAQGELGAIATGHRRSRAASPPRSVGLRHYDPARDFQAGLQRAAVAAGTRPDSDVDVPVACSAEAARGFAVRLAGQLAGQRETRVLAAGPAALAMLAGTRIVADGRPWRIARWTWRDRKVELETVADDLTTLTALPAEPGRALPPPPVPGGTFDAVLVALPGWFAPPSDAPRLALYAASATGSGFYEAVLRLPGGEAHPLGRYADAVGLGRAETILPPAPTVLMDGAHRVDVALLNPEMQLGNARDSDLAAGANAALLGDELIQYGRADPIGPGRYRLSRLWRGRGGSEWAVGSHTIGEAFVPLAGLADADADSLPLTVMPPAGSVIEVRRAGDTRVTLCAVPAFARAPRPLSPAAVRAAWTAEGGIALRWVRRSRAGFRWRDGDDAPLAEESERYRVTLESGGERLLLETDVPALTLSPAQVVRLAGPIGVAVVQLGAGGASEPARTAITVRR